MDEIFNVTNNQGVPFGVRVVRKGDSYGLAGGRVYEGEEPLVSFHVVDQAFNLGRPVSHYYAETLLELGPTEICLRRGGPSWRIEGSQMADVLEWVREQVAS
jgi:hypothetical protein